MYKPFLLVLNFIILTFLSLNLYSKEPEVDTILVFHPTKSNIEMINNLVEKNILEIDITKYHFLGVYHVNEVYDYNISHEFLLENGALPFSLLPIKSDLIPSEIFTQNQCTAIFIRLFNNSVGAFFLGGPDIPPGVFNEKYNLLTEVTDPARHYFELSYLFHVLGGYQDPGYDPLIERNPGYVILGICLGMQTLNVATGGTLIQDIPTELYNYTTREEVISNNQNAHRNYTVDFPDDTVYYTGYHFHPVEFVSGRSFQKNISALEKTSPFVLSGHHQAVEKLGKDLIPEGYSTDGRIIEAVSHQKYKRVFGVQFHPEKDGLYDSDLEYFVNSDSIINFNQFIKEEGSLDFHVQFWKMISELFQ